LHVHVVAVAAVMRASIISNRTAWRVEDNALRWSWADHQHV